jgi:hypothetical protein
LEPDQGQKSTSEQQEDRDVEKSELAVEQENVRVLKHDSLELELCRVRKGNGNQYDDE